MKRFKRQRTEGGPREDPPRVRTISHVPPPRVEDLETYAGELYEVTRGEMTSQTCLPVSSLPLHIPLIRRRRRRQTDSNAGAPGDMEDHAQLGQASGELTALFSVNLQAGYYYRLLLQAKLTS